ncbi:MAG: GGDEF domain-containing protein [Yoonia sp.]|nr:GGDEF domain-containing protein [Yoonia sp.]
MVGNFIWRPTLLGAQLLRHIAPIIGLLAGFLIAGGWLSARVAVHQTTAYLREQVSARTDSLTGVLNRAGLEELVRTPKFDALIKESKIALIYIDLNNFKTLNDERGHNAGDLALQVTAKRLRKSLRATDQLARLGGDEFLCLITDPDPTTVAKIATNRITFKTSQPIVDGHMTLSARVSMGVAISQADLTWDSLLLRADAAMYNAKRSKLVDAVFYAEELSKAS